MKASQHELQPHQHAKDKFGVLIALLPGCHVHEATNQTVISAKPVAAQAMPRKRLPSIFVNCAIISIMTVMRINEKQLIGLIAESVKSIVFF
ncbi:hypothetical protein PoB_000510600 [Plakobranchus ocellatus]|uniref:Uncharacterized protein n=1 Tax=Plakobranchus ocellatus TaxID=259542 RepID=A0AAV3Y5Y2_9GAST|nr:hypothetical protein PoB_000510600 [Plakobranchus ocellatus]